MQALLGGAVQAEAGEGEQTSRGGRVDVVWGLIQGAQYSKCGMVICVVSLQALFLSFAFPHCFTGIMR